MGDDRFDTLTRSLTHDLSRRGIARLVAGALLGGRLRVHGDGVTVALEKAARRQGGKTDDRDTIEGHTRNDSPTEQGREPADSQTQDVRADALPTESNEAGGDEVTAASDSCNRAGEPCTRGAECCTGKCLGNGTCSCNKSNPCPQPAEPCMKAVCSSTNRCVIKNKARGSSCSDGLDCTVDDRCNDRGVCKGTRDHRRCATANPCRPGRCRPGDPNRDMQGCVYDSISGGWTLTCGTGACERSVQQCVNGEEQTCMPGEPSPEVCDGIDNDCDGQIDVGACSGDLTCIGSTCGCASGTQCGDQCVDTQSNAQHCGGCNKPCGTNKVCVNQSCCTPLEGACRDNNECCAESYCDSTRFVCVPCTMCEETCCGEGSACEGNRCCARPGTGVSSFCGHDEHCCTGATCNIATNRCCIKAGTTATCRTSDQCCPGATCNPDTKTCCVELGQRCGEAGNITCCGDSYCDPASWTCAAAS